MGDWFQILADIDATEAQAPDLAAKTVDWLVSAQIIVADRTACILGTDLGHAPGPRFADAVTNPAFPCVATRGVEIRTGRSVFHGGQSGIDRISCPNCRAVTPTAEMIDSVGGWFDTGLTEHPCSACGAVAELNDWRWEPRWAFGYFGLRFWNWPELSRRFVDELAARLGHRIVVVADKL